MVSSDLVKMHLAWLEQGLDEYEAQLRLQSYLEAGFDPEMAAAAVNFELHMDQVVMLRERVDELEEKVAWLVARLSQTE